MAKWLSARATGSRTTVTYATPEPRAPRSAGHARGRGCSTYREGFDASAGAADYDAFANDTPVRTYDLSNARGGDDDGPMSDAEEASYQDALLGICMDLPMLRGRKAS